MADVLFNIAKGALVELFRDAASNGIVLLLEAVEADSVIVDYDDLNAFLGAAGNTEATATGYVRRTGITGTIIIDDVNDRVEVDLPSQSWTAVSGTDIVAAVVAYEESPSEAGRIPLVKHDWVITVDGTDLEIRFP